MGAYKDYSEYVGKQFGELMILSISELTKDKKTRRLCKCRCSCGKEVENRLDHVLSGRTKSCGHLRIKDHSEYVNKRFGELTILSVSETIRKNNRYRTYCNCRCSCNKEVETVLQYVLHGTVRSCGHVRTENQVKAHNQNPNCHINNKSTGIKNISFNKQSKLYVVEIARNKVRYTERTHSLEEAIKIKERILQELGEM